MRTRTSHACVACSRTCVVWVCVRCICASKSAWAFVQRTHACDTCITCTHASRAHVHRVRASIHARDARTHACHKHARHACTHAMHHARIQRTPVMHTARRAAPRVHLHACVAWGRASCHMHGARIVRRMRACIADACAHRVRGMSVRTSRACMRRANPVRAHACITCVHASRACALHVCARHAVCSVC